MLLEDWCPITHDMGLIKASVEETVAGLVLWHKAIGIEYVSSEITSTLADAFRALPPLSMAKRRRLFVATMSGWTACFQSGIDGSDPFPAMSKLSKDLGVLAMRVCSTHHSAKYPGNIWEVYAPEKLGGEQPLGYVRSISASNDGRKWAFSESGERFSFEKPEFYGLARKRDRFTRELLSDYLSHFALFPFSEDFYTISSAQPAIILERSQLTSQICPEFTVEQVIAGVPWKR